MCSNCLLNMYVYTQGLMLLFVAEKLFYALGKNNWWVISLHIAPPRAQKTLQRRGQKNLRARRWGSVSLNAAIQVWNCYCNHEHTSIMYTCTRLDFPTFHHRHRGCPWNSTLSWGANDHEWLLEEEALFSLMV